MVGPVETGEGLGAGPCRVRVVVWLGLEVVPVSLQCRVPAVSL